MQFNCLGGIPAPFHKWPQGGTSCRLDVFDVRGNPCSTLQHEVGAFSGGGSGGEGEEEGEGVGARPGHVANSVVTAGGVGEGRGGDIEDDFHCVMRLMASYDASLVPMLEEALEQV